MRINPHETAAGVRRPDFERDELLTYTGTLTEREWRAAVDMWLVEKLTYADIARRVIRARVFWQ